MCNTHEIKQTKWTKKTANQILHFSASDSTHISIFKSQIPNLCITTTLKHKTTLNMYTIGKL